MPYVNDDGTPRTDDVKPQQFDTTSGGLISETVTQEPERAEDVDPSVPPTSPTEPAVSTDQGPEIDEAPEPEIQSVETVETEEGEPKAVGTSEETEGPGI